MGLDLPMNFFFPLIYCGILYNMAGLRTDSGPEKFWIMCDASEVGYGAVLAQLDDSERLAPLAFHSAHYNEQGQRRPSVSRESFATAMSVYEFRWCVMGTVSR